MRYLMVVLSFALVFLLTPQGNAETLRIATWNIKNLNADLNVGATPRRQADYDRLKGYADRLNADIIALQEVDDVEAAERIFDPDVYNFKFENRAATLLNGFAYKDSDTFKLYRNSDITALNVGKQRRGVDITVSVGDTDIRILGLHLKSNCWDGPLDPGSRDCTKLKAQAPVIKNWISDRDKEGGPFVVLGNFNRVDTPGDAFWSVIDSASGNLNRVNKGRQQGCWSAQSANFLDHIGLDRLASGWMLPGSFQELVYDDADRANAGVLSDHCPLFVDIDVPDDFASPYDASTEIQTQADEE